MTTPRRLPWPAWAILVALTIGLFLAAQTEADALEPGATFDGGICWESDGTAGIAMADGECITPADYDVLFGFDNLDQVESLTSPGVSIAAEAGIDPSGPQASYRPRVVGSVTYEPFVDYVWIAHNGIRYW